MPKAAYTISMPQARTTSVVFASPHSGSDYAWNFLRRSVLDERAIRSSEDAFVDLLFGSVTEHGAPLLACSAPRAFVDVNRSLDELDPALIEGVGKSAHNPRVASGLGVVPRVVANGRAIYRGKISLREARARIDDYWHPYHDALTRLLDESRALYGEAILIDCHSMPREAIETISTSKGTLPDIVIGDRFGAAADNDVVELVEAAFQRAGLKTARNAPFAGAYVTQHYGRPSRGQHVLQIEIDRSLYMNETMIRPNGNFKSFQAIMRGVVAEIVEIGRRRLALAAE
ncbi:MAG: N-formylglutamate amidohydrolase [Paracoccaceae bacterium]|nr:N-formylglutamate amidohydrolase [Paracoccaceae bacterium]